MEPKQRKLSEESAPSSLNINKTTEGIPDNILVDNSKVYNTEAHAISNNPFKSDGLAFNPNSILPFISFNIDITLASAQMHSKFKEIIHQLDSEIKENNDSKIYTIIKKETGLLKTICSLFVKKNETITILCYIKEYEGRYDRIIELKAVTGDQINTENFMMLIIKQLIPYSKKIKIIKKNHGFFNTFQREIDFIFKRNKLKLMNTYSKKKEEEETMADSVNKEATSFYEIYRIISRENYELGKSISIFVNEFKIQNEKIESASILLPEQMKLTLLLIKSSSDSLNNYFNFGKSNTENMLKYCRPACEKFIFNKIYFKLFELYDYKYSNTNQKLKEKIKVIKDKLSVEEIMIFLEIKEKLRCFNNYKNNNYSENYLPYKSTIDCINKIEYEQSPNDKLNTLLNSGLDMRNTLLGCGANFVINSMDDELPIYIYISTQLNLKNSVAEFAMLDDYLKYCEWGNRENKILTNLMSAQEFILKSWKNI